jgi:hypothetical protein
MFFAAFGSDITNKVMPDGKRINELAKKYPTAEPWRRYVLWFVITSRGKKSSLIKMPVCTVAPIALHISFLNIPTALSKGFPCCLCRIHTRMHCRLHACCMQPACMLLAACVRSYADCIRSSAAFIRPYATCIRSYYRGKQAA